MTDLELIRQTLFALECNLPVLEDYGDKDQLQRQHKSIIVLRERLAQPEDRLDFWALFDENQRLRAELKFNTTPPQRPWVGLTPEEVKEISFANRPYVVDMVVALEAKLKEKNT